MIYYDAELNDNDVYLKESIYDSKFALKTETVFSQCNGYLGVRGGFENKILAGQRGMFVAGLYNKAYENEVTELVNCPDLIEMEMIADGECLSPDLGKILKYCRKLNVKTGELSIQYVLETKTGNHFQFCSRRFASRENLHLFCHMVEITPLDKNVEMSVTTGINGQITNSGVSHFQSVTSRVYEKMYLHTVNKLDGENDLSVMAVLCSNKKESRQTDYVLKRRSVIGNYNYQIKQKETLVLYKYSHIMDGNITESKINEQKQQLESGITKGFKKLYEEHWHCMEALWDRAEIQIEGASDKEKAVLLFAQYHMLGMDPFYTANISIGAKGLTGEGYKGHVFWDTEIYLLPFFMYVFPEFAKNLLVYRYRGLEGAREKARQYEYSGAMFPWEAAKDGREQTPLYAALNIHSGAATKVWSGVKEHHVTADIIYAVWNYYDLTKDHSFMEKYGYELTLEAAEFWSSRTVYNKDRNQYEIRDVIGPDEYTEHVHNNAYTNYMAKFCVGKGRYVLQLIENKKFVNERLADKWLSLSKTWEKVYDHLYLPKPNENGIIPQDDSFLEKRELPEIEKYRQAFVKQSVLLDYSRSEVIQMQVLKQADVVMLLNLFPNYFDEKTCKENLIYYEARTLHDSSLSVCAHAIACAHMKEDEMAWNFFQKALEVDLNENPLDTNDGIHAASLGGIWNSVIQGFAGVNIVGGRLHIAPSLPKHWNSMKFLICLENHDLEIHITNEVIHVKAKESFNKPMVIFIDGEQYEVIKECSHVYSNCRNQQKGGV